ncbi:MAG: hypothetical protein Tsb0020_19030 [Haliangiales bacterium]
MKVTDSGLKVIGRYEIIRTLGKGAMGVVYQARDPDLDRTVAIKTIVSPRKGKKVHAAYIERFRREAQAAAKMQHPAIVTIYDVGADSEAPYMVLEYLPGESLADRLDRVRFRLQPAVEIGLDLASALAFAHRQRIVHRDVKPANVLNAGENMHGGANRWKLADFGIARMPDSDLTQVGVFMGTPGYSPPEAIKFGHYTAQADVFAWGAVLYELLSGRIPYEGPDTRTTNGYVIKATAKSPRHYDPSIPEPLAEVVMTALNPQVSERYKDGAAAEHALRKAWETCLANNMIPSSSMFGEGVPHDKVRGPMHEGTITKVPEQAAEVSGEDDQQPPMLVIESSRGGISDDAPTQIIVRNPESFKTGAEGVASGSSGAIERPVAAAAAGSQPVAGPTPVASPPQESSQVRDPSGAVPRAFDGGTQTSAQQRPAGPLGSPRALFWVAIAAMLLTSAAILVHVLTR